MKTIKTVAVVSVLVFGMTTSVFASWWNPFSWNIFKSFNSDVTKPLWVDSEGNPVNRNTERKDKVLKQEETNQSTSTMENKVEKTNGWRTYTSTKGNYSISYPSDVKIIKNDSSCVHIYTKEFGSIYINSGSGDPCGIPTGVDDSSYSTSSMATVEGRQNVFSGRRNYNNAYSFFASDLSRTLGIVYGVEHFDKSNPNNYVELGALNEDEYQNALNSAKKILSTLKILPLKVNQVSGTENWKTYVDLDNRFSLKYPSTLSISSEKSAHNQVDTVRFQSSSESPAVVIGISSANSRWPDLKTLVNDQYLMSKGGNDPVPVFRVLSGGLKVQDVGGNPNTGYVFVGQLNQGQFIVFTFKDKSLIEQVLSSFKLPTNSQTIPKISSIEVVEGLPTGSVYAGQTAEIFGTNLRDIVSVKIGEQNVPVTTGIIADRSLDTDQIFKVPLLPIGAYNVSVTNSSGQVSNAYPVIVVVYSPR